MDEIHETLKENQLLARKFNRIERGLREISTPEGLFEHLFSQIEREFAVPFVWVSFIRKPPVAEMLGALEASGHLKDRLNLIDETLFLELVGQGTTPILVNQALSPYYKLLPKNIKYFLKSLAIAPLVVEGTIAGSLNLGDYSPGRYRPGMDTDLLQRLINSVSASLSAIMARNVSIGTTTGDKTGKNENA